MKKGNISFNPMRAVKIKDPSTHFFTSDLHFSHENIIKFTGRPWKDTKEMNEALIENWNAAVDTVKDPDIWVLGDFCMGGAAEWKSIIERLHGTIHLILGNHDAVASESMLNMFESYHAMVRMDMAGQEIWLTHFPQACYSGNFRGTWNLYGHVHTNKNYRNPEQIKLDNLDPEQYDVGVDLNDYRPINFYEVQQKIATRQYEKMLKGKSRGTKK